MLLVFNKIIRRSKLDISIVIRSQYLQIDAISIYSRLLLQMLIKDLISKTCYKRSCWPMGRLTRLERWRTVSHKAHLESLWLGFLLFCSCTYKFCFLVSSKMQAEMTTHFLLDRHISSTRPICPCDRQVLNYLFIDWSLWSIFPGNPIWFNCGYYG